ncbi:putative PilZ domain-containing protein [Azospirillaceae bacterium]
MSYQWAATSLAKASETEKIIEDMLSSWKGEFHNMDWSRRLSFLEQIDENIEFSIRRDGLSRELSQKFTRSLIEEVKSSRLICREQAYVYLNSQDETHRQTAQMWLVLNERRQSSREKNTPIVRVVTGKEKRTAPRQEINLPGLIASNDDHSQSARLLDVSMGGARVATKGGPKVGSTITLHVPLFEPIAASVVWLATTSVGLSFAVPQSGILF